MPPGCGLDRLELRRPRTASDEPTRDVLTREPELTTVLSVRVQRGAALRALLLRLRMLGVEIVAVRGVPPDDEQD